MYCDKCENYLESLSAENEKLQDKIYELEDLITELEEKLAKIQLEKQISGNAYNGSWDDTEVIE